MKYKHTNAEVFFTRKFCNDIVDNIDASPFGDKRNKERNKSEIYKDNLKGKLAEIFIFNEVAKFCNKPKIDFEIYEKGVGDHFDIQSSDFTVDVKASTPRARCLMVEVEKQKTWKNTTGYPSYMCMVAVTEEDDEFYSEYLFGLDFDSFRNKCKRYNRGDNIPNTNVQLRTDNFLVHRQHCSEDISDLKIKAKKLSLIN